MGNNNPTPNESNSNRWRCDTCNKSYAKASKYSHLKTAKHARSLGNNNPTPNKSNNQTPGPSNQTTQIVQLQRALRNSTKSFEVEVLDDKDPLNQLTTVRSDISNCLKEELTELRGIKYLETIKITFEKQLDEDRTTIKPAYFNGKVRTIINENEIEDALRLSVEQIINSIAQWISEGSGWTIVSIDAHYLT